MATGKHNAMDWLHPPKRPKKSVKLTTAATGEASEEPRPSLSQLQDWYAIEPINLPRFIYWLCRYIMLYETVICVMVCLSVLLVPYDCFFAIYDPPLSNAILVLDITYAIDVILRLLVEEWRRYAQVDCLVFMFPYSLPYFVTDLISLFSIDRVLWLFTNMETKTFNDLEFLELWQAVILLRAYRVIIYFRALEANGLLYETMIFVIKFTVAYLAFIMVVTVGFFFFTNTDEIDFFLLAKSRDKLRGTWAEAFINVELIDTPFGFFILAFNFATVVVTTVGYGDISPTTESEMLGSIFVMLFGAIFMSGFFQSTITSFCLQLDGARLDLFHRLDGIKIALRQASMGDFFTDKVEQYYKCLWTYREGVDTVMFMSHLPVSFREDIYYDICLEMFQKSYLFYGLDEAFLRSVSNIVTIALYTPGMIVCRFGGYANKMYYIIQGECQVMSKHDLSKRAAILRAGSIIGETNLFFSCPYTISVETRSCCQLMSIDKEELMQLFNKFENELSVLRSRSQTKTNDMYYYYEMKGEDPVCWVEMTHQARSQIFANPEDLKRCMEPKWPLFTMRWGSGVNDVVTDDVILDSEEYVIFDAICEDPEVRKNHVVPYTTSVVPEILCSDVPFIRFWNRFIVINTFLYLFFGPYCLAFSSSSSLVESFICTDGGAMDYMNDLIFLVDVFVEIFGAAPVEGFYYKFQDGVIAKMKSVSFYLDVLSGIPLSLAISFFPAAVETNVVLKSTKIWKVIRYLDYHDNIHPKHVFWFRLLQTCLVLVFGIHFIACTVYVVACPIEDPGDHDHDPISGLRDCVSSTNWLWSYINRAADTNSEEVDDTVSVKDLATKNPYLISFYYASATLTSAGFGDFSPQNRSELVFAVVFTLMGFFLICYYTSILTSALACIVKPRLEFQQKLVSVRRFMQYYKLPDSLQRRVEQYYELQHQARHGINLPHAEHFLFDAPSYLKNDYLYTATALLFDGVPLFSKAEPKYIIRMADKMRRFLIPPNTLFLHTGEVRRAMYIVQSGSVGVFEQNSDQPKSILEASSHFGIKDLLFGEPSHYTIRTMSYCYIYEITNDLFVDVFEEDAELIDLIEDERELRHDEIENMYNEYSVLERDQHADRFIETPSWIYFRPNKTVGGRKGHQYLEYVSLFNEFRGGKVMRYFLQNATVNPVGTFAKWWTCLMSLCSCLTVMLLFVETFMFLRLPTLRYWQRVLDLFFYVDIYIKLHWGYYHPKTGLLISHPLKTAGAYILQGSFFADVVCCTPLEWIVFAYGKTDIRGYGAGATWYTKLRWIRLLQIKRIPQIFSIAHSIFVKRTYVLLLLFVTLTLVACTIVGAVAIFIACPWSNNDWEDGDEYRLPSCSADRWANTKFMSNSSETQRILLDATNRWLFGLYYVSQVLLVIGFGDMITLNRSEIFLLILMSVFGFVFMRCVLADMTAAEVDSDEVRARFTEGMKTLVVIMEREKLNRKLITTVHDHLNNMWKRSKGLQPGQLFSDLHPSLESDVFRSFVGDTLRKIAVFKDFTPNVLRTLCLYLKKLHFLKGERIMQFGNLEYDMFIIVSGKVWITDRRLSYGCTLKRFETFGESSMLSYAPRRYTAIAATGVEVFMIAREKFDELIERYPKVKDILSALLHNGDYDYFEYKIYEMIDKLKELTGEERDRQIDILQARTNEIKSVVSGKGILTQEEAGEIWSKTASDNPLVRFLAQVISMGTDDDELPFIYFVARRNKNTGKYSMLPPLIHPNCGFSRLYFTCIYLFCIISPALAIYEYSFSQTYLKNKDLIQVPQNTDERIQEIIHRIGNDFEYFLLTFILMSLITPYQNEEGHYVKDFPSIAANYIFAIDGIWLDILSSFPGIIWDDYRIVLLLTRSIRLYRYYSHYIKKADDLSVSPFRLKIQLAVSTFVLLAHFVACCFYQISDCEGEENETLDPEGIPCINPKALEASRNITYSWTFQFTENRHITTNAHDGMYRWKWWLRSLYWVVTVISTTGFGDIVPQNINEMIVGIICFFSGAFILSIILSSFTAGMTSITKAHREYLYQVKLLLKYLNNVGLSENRQGQVTAYFDLLWSRCRGRMYHEVTSILPTSLKIEVCNALFMNVLNKVYLFNIRDSVFIKQVASRVKHSIYYPGVCIVKEGDVGSSLYIVMKGVVCGIAANDSPAMELKKVYLVGDVFGKMPCLFNNEWYKKTYRAEEYTEVLELHSRDLIHLATVYSDFWHLLKVFVETTYDPDGASDCIFSPQRARQKNIYDLGEDYQKEVMEKQKKKPAPAAAANVQHRLSFSTHARLLGKQGQQHPAKKKKPKKLDTHINPIKFLYNTTHLKRLQDKTESITAQKEKASQKDLTKKKKGTRPNSKKVSKSNSMRSTKPPPASTTSEPPKPAPKKKNASTSDKQGKKGDKNKKK